MSFGDQIRQAVQDSGMSCYRICKLSGLNKGAMSNFLAGKRGMSLDSLNRLAAVLDLHVVRGPAGPQGAAGATQTSKTARRSAGTIRRKVLGIYRR